MNQKPEFTAVLFDFDGTLADTAADVWDSVAYGFTVCGLTLDPDFSGDPRNLAMPVTRMVELLYPELPEEVGQRVRQNVNYHYQYISQYEKTVLYDGILELLQWLKSRHIPMGILSNKTHDALERVLEIKGWRQYFDAVQGTEPKPVELDKVQRLGAFAKRFSGRPVAYVGDSPWDVEAARGNGLFSVGVLYGDGDAALVQAAKPDVVCVTPAALKEFFTGGKQNVARF